MVSPSSGVQGATVPVTLTGAGFLSSGTRLNVSGTGVIVLNTRITDDTHLAATLVLSGEAGTRAISVETSAAPSNSVSFQITPSPADAASPLYVEHLTGSTGGAGYADGAGSAARFVSPGYMWGDNQNVYVSASEAIRKIDLTTAQVRTIGGISFNHLKGIWSDGAFLYVVDSNAGTFSKVDPSSGQITTIATNLRRADGLWGDGTYLYLVMFYSIARIEIATGKMTTLAGSENSASVDGVGSQAAFQFPTALWGNAGFLYVADLSKIREINTATAAVRTIATITEPGYQGSTIPSLLTAISGGNGSLYLARMSGIVKLDLGTGVTTTISTMALSSQTGLFENSGQLYVADGGNHVIRKINLATSAVTILAGAIAERSITDGNATTARFYNISSVTSDGTNLYVGDESFTGQTIGSQILFRKVNLATGTVTTLSSQAGNITSYPNGGSWTDGAFLYYSAQNLNSQGGQIRRINLATGQDTVFAGSSGTQTLTPVDGSASDARFPAPTSLWGDGQSLYVLDAVLQFCPFGGGPSSCLYPVPVQTILRQVQIATGAVTTIPFPNLFATPGFQNVIGSMWGDGPNLYFAGGNSIVRVTIATGTQTTIASVNQANSIWGDGQFLYVTSSRYTVTRIDPNTGDTAVIAGLDGIIGTEDGLGTAGRFQGPRGIWGDGTHIYVGDLYSIRRLSAQTAPTLTGTFEPQLVEHLAAGFYIVEANLAAGASSGFWGLEVLASRGQMSGGFDLGGGLAAQAAEPGFGAFYLPTPQTVTAHATTPLAPNANLMLRLLDSSRQPVTSNATSSPDSASLQAALQPGFYIVETTTDSSVPLSYSLELAADFFGGGVDTGGYVGPGITGFGAFYLPVEQDVSLHMFGQNTYGTVGAGSLVLTLRDANRNVIRQVGP